MSYAPFDGVLLDDLRPPMPGALAIVLHLQVAERLGGLVSRDALEARGAACRELMAHGLLPEAVRGLLRHGLDLGDPKSQHSLASLINHLEHYLEAVSAAGYIEPDVALWNAVSNELSGRRGLWVERTPQDGPLDATLRDLQPARLRALACLPQLGGATFRLATSRGGGGLFGSGQPLSDWFLDGLEAHGQGFAADIQLAEPDGWGDAPWSGALDQLFEGRLDLDAHRTCFRRGLADSPWDLLRHAVEQTMEWIHGGIDPKDITIIHPEPEKVRDFIEAPLNAQGVLMSSKSSMRPLIQCGAWSPIWTFLNGLSHLDPFAVAVGLHTTKRPEIRDWAEMLAAMDQSGQQPFETSLAHLHESHGPEIKKTWRLLLNTKKARRSPTEWGAALSDLVGALQLPAHSDDFYAPLGLLKEIWGLLERQGQGADQPETWGYDRMLASLRLFLESARGANAPNSPDGVKLVAPSALLDDWDGAEATLILDLSEGAWPARPMPNPDLDWDRRADINAALLKASENYNGQFPPALQRFWLPRAEHASQMPRAFQREAYAFNKVLAMTKQHIVALSPSQDDEGRNVAQGAFWTAIEGAAQWAPNPETCASNLRWSWEGFHRQELADSRSKAVRALGFESLFLSTAPPEDHIPELRPELLHQKPHASPTLLESLVSCPFRTIAERVWRLDQGDTAGEIRKSVGTMTHSILQKVFDPLLGKPDWPSAFLSHYNLEKANVVALEDLLSAIWQANKADWLEGTDLNPEQIGQVQQQVGALLPKMAAYLRRDIKATCPIVNELTLLYPDKVEMGTMATSKHPMKEGWSRTITGLEQKLGPMELSTGDTKTMPIEGKVDRLEKWENHIEKTEFLRVTDYKTSSSRTLAAFAADDAPFATHLQTPLYIWMVMETFKCNATSVLVPLRDGDPRPFADHLDALAVANLSGVPWQSKLARTLAKMDDRIKQGDYPATPGEHCKHCGYSALCMRPVDVEAADEEDENDD